MPTRFSGSPRDITLTNHALTRMRQRGFTATDISTIVEYGRPHRLKDGRMLLSIEWTPFFVLDDSGTIQRLVDSSVLLAPDGVVVTVYRNDERCPLYWTSVQTE